MTTGSVTLPRTDSRHAAPAWAWLLAAAVVMLLARPAAAALPLGGDGDGVPSLAPVIEEVQPSVVNIAVRASVQVRNPLMEDPMFRRFFGMPEGGQEQRRQVRSAGSGVIVDAENGYIITNHHVIDNAEEITVTLFDDRTFSAEVVGSDSASDIAVLKVDGNDLRSIDLGDSDRSRVGDFVVAIGNPFGLQHTVTSGIISALGRSGINPNPDGYEDFIQTDASINPGNSGGALVNLRGELIGINSAIFTQRGGGNIGIGFAIPVNMARAVMDQILEHGEVRRGLLGVSIMSVNASIAQAYDLEAARGALVTQVQPDSAAEAAGVQVDDIIIRVNERGVDDAGQLRNAIGMRAVGDEVELTVIRDGERRQLRATLKESSRQRTGDAGDIDESLQGAELADYDASAPNYVGQDGVLVVDVAENSPAAQRGLRAGDIIFSVNRNRVRNLGDLEQALEGSGAAILRIQRGNQTQLLPIR